MPILQQLKIDTFRNITHCRLNFKPRFNLIYGQNGSGKTSLLEAIYTLANGKSFRAAKKHNLIQHKQDNFTVFATLEAAEVHKIGLQKSLNSNAKLQIDGEKCRSLSRASKLLPVIFLDPHSTELIELGPGQRRQYLDWALFHVEHDYAQQLQQYMKCLQQRNCALKQRQSDQVCRSWDKLLVELAGYITLMRQQVLLKIFPHFTQLVESLGFSYQIGMSYRLGWDAELTFKEALDHTYPKDRLLGYTSIGPQRADIEFSVDEYQAADVLSRGQEKLLVISVLLAQGEYYRQTTKQQAIYLFDDISSELDMSNQNKLVDLFTSIPGQYFITSLNDSLHSQLSNLDLAVFHVEQGEVSCF